ncbi:hypothetical protein [Tropicimonas aquimaris]|uniref:Seryl-tRNA synthetase n=1 Tax=Tropicimonas aquimaris TaxID=914152 RepID=A0ABW3ILK9_9RHOB
MSDPLQDPSGDSPGKMKAILLVTAAAAFAAAPAFVPFNGFDPTLFPIPQVDAPAQPAGYAFAIWGVIYLWLVVHAVYGLVARADDPAWDAPRWPLMVALVPGTAWLSVASFSPIWATILIFVMLGGALAAMLSAPRAQDPWLLGAPIELFAGWLTAASCVSLALLGAGYGIVFGQTIWAVIALALATGIALWVQQRRPGSWFHALGVIWALIAVAVSNFGGQWLLALLALAAAGLIAARTLRAVR